MSVMNRLPWELIGAIVGAGLASGREVASFFAQYGPWSWLGIALAVGVLFFLADVPLPASWQGRLPGKAWRALQTLLLTATGGAMLAGAGEVAALTLPLHGAWWIGAAGTLVLSCFLARRTVSGLAWVSRCLLAVLAVLVALGLTRPPMQAAFLHEACVPEALLRGMAYGGFNAALQSPIMARHAGVPQRTRQRAALVMCAALGALLCLLNAVLLRHPVLLAEPMPFIRLTAQLGPIGYALGALTFCLAILSTLTACLAGLGGGVLPVIGVMLVACAGFTGAVETLYPLLGGGCLLLLIGAKWRNSR